MTDVLEVLVVGVASLVVLGGVFAVGLLMLKYGRRAGGD